MKRCLWLVGSMLVFAPLWAEDDNGQFPQGPNHLEPIAPYDHFGDDYYQIVFRALIGRGNFDCWMICRPSFQPEYAVALKEEVSKIVNANPKDPFTARIEYDVVLEVAVATKQIWHYEQPEGGKLQLDLLKNVKIDRKKIGVTKDFRDAITEAWRAVLRLTRYAEEDSTGLDGTVYDFFCTGNFFGTTWTPEVTKAPLPSELVKLAKELRAIVESAPEKRQALQDEALKHAAKMKAAAEEEYKKLKRPAAPAK